MDRCASTGTCTVYFRDHAGKPIGGHVTAASSVFEACRKALAHFESPHWLGPRPSDDTILEISLVSSSQKWKVRVASIRKQTAKQTQLFERSAEALDPQR